MRLRSIARDDVEQPEGLAWPYERFPQLAPEGCLDHHPPTEATCSSDAHARRAKALLGESPPARGGVGKCDAHAPHSRLARPALRADLDRRVRLAFPPPARRAPAVTAPATCPRARRRSLAGGEPVDRALALWKRGRRSRRPATGCTSSIPTASWCPWPTRCRARSTCSDPIASWRASRSSRRHSTGHKPESQLRRRRRACAEARRTSVTWPPSITRIRSMLASEPYGTLAQYAVSQRRSPSYPTANSHPPIPDSIPEEQLAESRPALGATRWPSSELVRRSVAGRAAGDDPGARSLLGFRSRLVRVRGASNARPQFTTISTVWTSTSSTSGRS